MKRTICSIGLILIFVFCAMTVAAAKDEYSFDLPKEFTGAKRGENLDELSSIFGMSDEELADYYEQHNLIFLAANKENTCQVKVTCTENDFSESAVSFSSLSDLELKTVGNELAGDTFQNLGIVKAKDGNKYIKLSRSLRDSGGAYTATEYITVCSQKLYTVNISVSENLSEDITETIFEGVSITDKAAAGMKNGGAIYIILIAVGIAVFSTVAVILTVTIIKDIKTKRNPQ